MASTAIVLTPLLLALATTNANASESAPVSSTDPQTIVIVRKGAQPPQPGPSDNFTGSVHVERFFQPKDARMSGALVTFEPGARTAWHSHPLGQTLIVTAGSGRVQQWGGPIDEIRPGDVVWIPPGQKHWHGGAPTTAMSHIAVVPLQNGKSTDWMEKVTDAQYSVAVRGPAAPAVTPAD